MKWSQSLAVIFFALWLITALCLVDYYETEIKETNAKNEIVIDMWDELSDGYMDLIDRQKDKIAELRKELRETKKYKFRMIRSN